MKKLFFYLGLLFCSFSGILHAQYSAEFDGVDDYAYRSHHNDFNFYKDDFTIEAQISNWVSTNYHQAIYSKHAASGGLEFGIDSLGSLYVVIGTTTITDFGNSRITDASCHHIAVSREAGLISFYLDGQSYSASGSYNIDVDNSNAVYIGRRFNSTNYFKGSLDELRVWDVAKSTGDIDNMANSCLIGNENDLVAYWSIESPSQVFDDATLHHHDARLGNAYTADAADPQWATKACYALCCNAAADFLIDVTTPSANQYVNFTNASSNASSYQWIVNGVQKSTDTDFTFIFPLGTHIVQLVAFGDADCRSFKTWVVEVSTQSGICGHEHFINEIKADSLTNAELDSLRARIRNHINQGTVKTTQQLNNYTIPVVFHMVGNNANTLTNAQIQAQLDILNDAFADDLGSTFASADDAQVTFCLAQNAPNNQPWANFNATTHATIPGITRFTSAAANNVANNHHVGATGANSPQQIVYFDPSRYLNIWVVNHISLAPGGQNTVLGYSPFPLDIM